MHCIKEIIHLARKRLLQKFSQRCLFSFTKYSSTCLYPIWDIFCNMLNLKIFIHKQLKKIKKEK